jgi:hypothetical protein
MNKHSPAERRRAPSPEFQTEVTSTTLTKADEMQIDGPWATF